VYIITIAQSFVSTLSQVMQISNRFPARMFKGSKTNTSRIFRTIPGVMAVELCKLNFHVEYLCIELESERASFGLFL